MRMTRALSADAVLLSVLMQIVCAQLLPASLVLQYCL